MDEIITLQAVITVLNQITLSGKENLGRLVGCINTLEDLTKKLQESARDESNTEA